MVLNIETAFIQEYLGNINIVTVVHSKVSHSIGRDSYTAALVTPLVTPLVTLVGKYILIRSV